MYRWGRARGGGNSGTCISVNVGRPLSDAREVTVGADRPWVRLARIAIASMLFGAALAACYGPGASIPGPPSPGPPSAAVPTASNGAVSYSPDMAWAFLASTPGLQRAYDDLASAVNGSDAVVVGRFVGLERGPSYAAPGEVPGWHAIAQVQMDQVLKGGPNLAVGAKVQVQFVLAIGGTDYPEATFANLTRSIPASPALLLLETWATYFARAGGDIPKGFEALNSKAIYRTIGGDGAVRIEQGVLAPPPYVDGWPLALKGVPLTGVEAQIRSLVAAKVP